jgi:hypothetical protein
LIANPTQSTFTTQPVTMLPYQAPGNRSQRSQSPTAELKRTKFYRYKGYPEYARYITSDNDALLFRRFGELNARILLSLQNDIEIQEKYLKALDEKCARDPQEFALMNSLEWAKNPQNPHPERNAVLQRLRTLLHTYDNTSTQACCV